MIDFIKYISVRIIDVIIKISRHDFLGIKFLWPHIFNALIEKVSY